MALLSAEHIEMIASGVSAIVAAHDAEHRPSLMRAVGASITPDGGRITVWLSRSAAAQLLANMEATQRLAVVFSEPTTNRAVQVKARAPEFRPARPADEPLLQAYLAAMTWQLTSIAFAPSIPRAMLAYRLDDVVAVSFAPEEAYDQTPGRKT